MAELELKLLRWAETYFISEALQQQDFIELELKKSAMRYQNQQKRDNFSIHCLNAKDDATVISQLEMNAFSLSMMVKFKWLEYELLAADKEDFSTIFDFGKSQAGGHLC